MTDQAWVRRLYTCPDGNRLLSMDSKQQLFPSGLATFLRLRDQRCATPFCDAPVQHIDHIEAHARGGPTNADNGQGLCARCNYTKEIAGFTSRRDPVTGETTLTTPTGHQYRRTPAPGARARHPAQGAGRQVRGRQRALHRRGRTRRVNHDHRVVRGHDRPPRPRDPQSGGRRAPGTRG